MKERRRQDEASTRDAADRLRAAYCPAPDEDQQKWCRLAQKGDRAARDRLVLSMTAIVVQRARRYAKHGTAAHNCEDLTVEGFVGLMRAIDKFDFREGVKFCTYADYWIRQAMTRSLANDAKNVRVPVYRDIDRQAIYRATNRLFKRRVTRPTDEELARETGMTVKRVRETLDSMKREASLDGPVTSGYSHDRDGKDRALEDLLADGTAPLDEAFADDRFRKAVRKRAAEIRAGLSPRDQAVFDGRFYGHGSDEKATLSEVAAPMGRTRERVRQIELKLKKRLQLYFRAEFKMLEEMM